MLEGSGWKISYVVIHKFHLEPREDLSLSRERGFTPESVAQFFGIYEPAMDTIQHNPARLYNCDETGITIVKHKHTKILGLKAKPQISSLQFAERASLVTVVACMSPTGHFFPSLLVFPRKNMKKELMDGTSPGSIHACHPSEWIQSVFCFPEVSSFHQTYKARKRKSCYLSTGRALFTHKEPGGHYFCSRESCWHHLPPTHSSHEIQPLVKVVK